MRIAGKNNPPKQLSLGHPTMSAPRVESVHVGTPPEGYQEWTTTKVHFHGFADLSTERVAHRNNVSPEFIACGNPWRLWLYPGGRQESRTGWVGIYLVNLSNKSITMHYGFSIKDGNGKQVANKRRSTYFTFSPMSGRAWPDFAKRSKLLDSLVDGTLIIEVHMKLQQQPAKLYFIPENPSACKIIPFMFNNDESADIVFQVSQQSKNSAAKVARIAPVTFHAHCLIVRACSTVLADLCQSKGDLTTPIEITDVSPDIFRHLLYYIYGGKISNDDMKEHSKDIINAANRYGVSTLKLEAEACLVENLTFSLENMMEHLIYADSMNCALLKEATMDYIMENKDEVLEKITFDEMIPGNLMRDLLAAVVRGENRTGRNKLNAMRICKLRLVAHKNGLEVDGSREMLIASLKAHFTSKRETVV
jgi:hypothetical protein